MSRFAWSVAIGLATTLIALALFTAHSAPAGFLWLGDGMHNPSDVAVYLSYLQQGADGHIFLRDLFAVEPHRLRFDPIWSGLGLVARTGIDPIVIHEAGRAFFSILLVVALWFAAKSVTKSERDANLALLLSIFGIATGWIYSIWLGSQGLWTPTTYAAPDIVTEFAVGPILFGGAHVILSLALLVTAIRWLWNGIQTNNLRLSIRGALVGAVLLAFHPYFAALLAIIGLLAWVTSTKRRDAFRSLVVSGLILVPPVAYYVWLLLDPVFGDHHLTANLLPLAPLPVWLITLAPFIVALGWMWHKKLLPKRLDWTSAWILSTILLLIILPVPWKRKLTEGLAVPLVFLTLPAWLAVRDWVSKQQPKWMSRLLATLLILAAGFGPLHLVISHASWIYRTDQRGYFYQPSGLFEAASFLKRETDTEAVLLSDDRWINVWLPALTGRRVWIGHDHETPDFERKRELYHELLATTDPARLRALLDEMRTTHIVITTDAGQNLEALLDSTWTKVFSSGTVRVWKIQ
ncbi:MAG: hypothetical protein WC787_04295 [Patescibacteria group bacterium]|jgi:hypothetical protein